MGVVVQQMVPSERSGVMFTVDPSTGGTDTMVVEAAFGQGEVVVSGRVEPDTYVLRKEARPCSTSGSATSTNPSCGDPTGPTSRSI